jgi:hypothetical protein
MFSDCPDLQADDASFVGNRLFSDWSSFNMYIGCDTELGSHSFGEREIYM